MVFFIYIYCKDSDTQFINMDIFIYIDLYYISIYIYIYTYIFTNMKIIIYSIFIYCIYLHLFSFVKKAFLCVFSIEV